MQIEPSQVIREFIKDNKKTERLIKLSKINNSNPYKKLAMMYVLRNKKVPQHIQDNLDKAEKEIKLKQIKQVSIISLIVSVTVTLLTVTILKLKYKRK